MLYEWRDVVVKSSRNFGIVGRCLYYEEILLSTVISEFFFGPNFDVELREILCSKRGDVFTSKVAYRRPLSELVRQVRVRRSAATGDAI